METAKDNKKLHEYFGWLLNQIGAANKSKEIKDLLLLLHEIDFTWTIPNDKNRDLDGLKLRMEFFHGDEKVKDIPRSVLEVLIGLSNRVMDDVLGDDESDENYIWEMLENLGLVSCGKVLEDRKMEEQIVRRWLNREFDEDGNGSPFPIKINNPKIDQREIEIWQQLCLYLYDKSRNL